MPNATAPLIIEQQHHFTPDQQHRYFQIDFELTDDVERIDVAYAYSTGAKIDLALEYQGNSRGWSGSERAQIYVEQDLASPGYLPGIFTGHWAVVLGTHTLKQPTEVTVVITLTKRHGRWISGDFHSHTNNSDGLFSIQDAITHATQSGIEFLAMTDHHTVAHNYFIPQQDSLLIIPGTELTTYHGHANLLGHPNPVANFRATSAKDIARLFAEAKRNGATIGINHPFVHCGWEWGFEHDFDYIEVWNGPWGMKSQRALQWWHQQLCNGRKLPVIGGSDFHRPVNFHPHVEATSCHGRPITRVYSMAHSVAGLLEAVRLGRAVIADDINGPHIEITQDSDQVIGAEIALQSELVIRVDQLATEDQVWLITPDGETCISTKQHMGRCQYIHQIETRFIRIEVRGARTAAELPRAVALTNPVYAGAMHDSALVGI